MVAIAASGVPRPLHPLHAIFLAFTLPLFLGAFLADLAYAASPHVQWTNFAAWLIAGGLLFGAFALLWAFVDIFRGARPARGRRTLYFVVLLSMWVLGFLNALIHAKDAWAAMPNGLILSGIVALLALVGSWMGYARRHFDHALPEAGYARPEPDYSRPHADEVR